jgi:hypothetical protein
VAQTLLSVRFELIDHSTSLRSDGSQERLQHQPHRAHIKPIQPYCIVFLPHRSYVELLRRSA